ncbi:MAG: hypothetical protein P1U67_13085 [Alcanivoracaceae bacterium]|nr:hypothetical protein [Alcanivoracaceae bacterium]
MKIGTRIGALLLALATVSCAQPDTLKGDAATSIDTACTSAMANKPHCGQQSWWWNLP